MQETETLEDKTKRLKRLAMDCAAGLVFTDRHLPRKESLLNVFLPLALMSHKEAVVLNKKIGARGVIYEYVNKAAPRSHNGFPSFFSVSFIPHEDAEEFLGYWQEEVDRRQAVAKN